MSQNSLISVIIIFYNAQSFIEEAVDSVLRQTYTNWELLLVDDGSSDRSTEIAKSYVNKYPGKIKYLEHPLHQNKGMSSTRNLGIDNSSGNLICFLDADDLWMNDKLESQKKIMDKHPDVMMLYGNTLFWWSWSEGHNQKDYIPKLGVNANQVFNPPDLVTRYLIVSAAVPGTCSIMCRKELFNRIKFEDSFRGLYEDQAFYYKVCLSEKVYVSDKIWDKYRQHDSSACYIAERNGELYKKRKAFLVWLFKYIFNNKFDNPAIILAICQEYWKNRLLEQIAETKYSGIVRWLIKRYFIFERQVFPEKLIFMFWKNSKTYNQLSSGFNTGVNEESTSELLGLK